MNPKTSTLLTYTLDTLPDPLQASPKEGNIVYGTLTFVVSNSGNRVVQLSQLQITLPAGDLAQQLTTNPGAILWATGPDELWNVTMSSPGVFLFLPKSGRPIPVSVTGMVLQLFNIPINQEVGGVSIEVDELATNTADPAQTRKASFEIAKFPNGFYFGNFTAQVPMVQDGGTVTLLWQGSDNGKYTMQWNLSDQPVDVTDVRKWVSHKLTGDTTFLLRAQVTFQGETVTRDLTTTVIVANPEFQAKSLTVYGVSQLEGATTIGTGLNSQATVNGKLTVNGQTMLEGVTTLKGQTTAGDVTVNGKLIASSAAQFNNVSINGTVSAIKAAQGVGEGTYVAKTDGILMAYVSAGGADPSKYCYGYVIVQMPWLKYWVGSGNYKLGSGTFVNSASGLSIPLQQGQQCSIAIKTEVGLAPLYSVVFIPLGSISQSEEMLVKVSDELPDLDIPEPHVTRRASAEAIADAFLEASKDGDKKKLVHFLKEYVTGS